MPAPAYHFTQNFLYQDTMLAVAQADLAAFRFVGPDGNYAGADGAAHGVLLYDTPSGTRGTVARFGRCRIEAGGAINAGDKVVSDANGLPVAAGVDPANVIAIALTSTAAAGEPVELMVQ